MLHLRIVRLLPIVLQQHAQLDDIWFPFADLYSQIFHEALFLPFFLGEIAGWFLDGVGDGFGYFGSFVGGFDGFEVALLLL